MDDAETSSEPPGRSPGTPADVDVVDSTGDLPAPDRDRLCDAAARALAHLGCAGSLRVRIVDDGAMGEAHERWSGVRGTTDVLTFDLGTQGRELDADVLVCLDEARRQGGARGHEAWRELLLYVVHAALHCLGHDDHDEIDARAMHRLEDETLEAIGVGQTYVGGPGDGDPSV